jgi:hypothetical integral membrane protein (TIGR02206 family)
MFLFSTTIETFSKDWFLFNGITFFLIGFLIVYIKQTSLIFIKNFTKKLALFFLFEFLLMQFYYIFNGTWSVIESLPFHLCSIMWFNAIYLLLYKKQWSFELMLFIGMPAAFHSLLTPQLNHGDNFIFIFDFFFSHGWLFAVSFYCIFVLKMRPRVKSWWYSFLRLQDFIFIIFIFNFIINFFSFGYIIPPFDYSPTSNYMYLLNPPIANNPFVLGPWPNYILGLLGATFLHSFVIYLPFYFLKKIKND